MEHVACMVEMINAYRVLIWKSCEKRTLWRPRRRWKDNIKMHVRFEVVTAVKMSFVVFWVVTS
jgi:hypothetical protein